MSGYLVDTNTVSYIIRGKPSQVREHLARVSLADVALSSVTEAELRFGVERKPEAKVLRVALEEFLMRVVILAWDSAAAQEYARLRAQIERVGEPMGNVDLMLAAHVLATGAVLVTSDRAFLRIKQLSIEDWTRA